MTKTYEAIKGREIFNGAVQSDHFMANCFSDFVPPARLPYRQHPHYNILKMLCDQFRCLKDQTEKTGGVVPSHRAAQYLFRLLWESTKDIHALPSGEMRSDGKGGLQVVWMSSKALFIIHADGASAEKDFAHPNGKDLSPDSMLVWLQEMVENMNTNNMINTSVTPEMPDQKIKKTLGRQPGPNRQTHKEALAATIKQYDYTLRVLAGIQSVSSE